MELEGSILAAEERAAETERARVDVSGKLAASEARAAEIARAAERAIDDLNKQLGEARLRGADLDRSPEASKASKFGREPDARRRDRASSS